MYATLWDDAGIRICELTSSCPPALIHRPQGSSRVPPSLPTLRTRSLILRLGVAPWRTGPSVHVHPVSSTTCP